MIIADCGSTHDGDLKKAKELVRIAEDCGADAIKFQLLTAEQLGAGNIMMPWEWLEDLIPLTHIDVFASVFDLEGIDYLEEIKCRSIKLPYSKRGMYNNLDFRVFSDVFVSSGIMDEQHGEVINLYCIPEYPVPYTIYWGDIFTRFDGFSDHTLALDQTYMAIEMMRALGKEPIIEKHFQGYWDSPCPDAKFAIKPDMLEDLCKTIR